MGAKIKTQNKALGLQTKPKKSLDQKLTPRKSHAEILSHKNFWKALNDITWWIETSLLNTPKNPYLNQTTQKLLAKIFLYKKIPKSSLSLEIHSWNWLMHNVSVKSKLQHPPPGHTPGIWHLCRPGEEGIWLSESSRGWGIWSPCFRGGEFELHPRFHVKSLAWRAMGDAVLEDFRGKDCAFVANWLRGKGLNKLCAVFEGI